MKYEDLIKEHRDLATKNEEFPMENKDLATAHEDLQWNIGI